MDQVLQNGGGGETTTEAVADESVRENVAKANSQVIDTNLQESVTMR